MAKNSGNYIDSRTSIRGYVLCVKFLLLFLLREILITLYVCKN